MRPTWLRPIWRHCLLSSCLSLTLLACDEGSSTDLDPGADPGQQGDPDATVQAPLEWCQGSTVFEYDPEDGRFLAAFPDDAWTAADPDTPTGLKVEITPEKAPWLEEVVGNYDQVFQQYNTLDGFGTNAAVWVRFNGPIGDLPEGSVQLLDLGDETPVSVPAQIFTVDDDATIIISPDIPLRPATPHAVVVTTEARDQGGNCIAVSHALQQVLTGEGEGLLEPLNDRYAALLSQTGLKADEISAAVVFTPQSVVEPAQAILNAIENQAPTWSGGANCSPFRGVTRCERTFKARNFRGEDRVIDLDQPIEEYDVTASIWMPASSSARRPFPVLIIGHGLGGSREQAASLSAFVSVYDLAVVAIDAVGHGEHPGGVDPNVLINLLDFFGVIRSLRIPDALVLRDNFRQSTYDKLQLIEAIVDDPDVDGDGTPDLDPDKMGYLGFSLGGIMGTELLALSDRLEVGLLLLAGARMPASIQDSVQLRVLVDSLVPRAATDGDRARLFPVIQGVTDAGDGASFAPYILKNRLSGSGSPPPHVLFQMVLDDELVPNSASYSLARALGIPHAPPVQVPHRLLPEAPSLPYAGNLADGELTAGFFEFRKVSRGASSSPEPASHGNLVGSLESTLQLQGFLQPWLNNQTPEIINPWR